MPLRPLVNVMCVPWRLINSSAAARACTDRFNASSLSQLPEHSTTGVCRVLVLRCGAQSVCSSGSSCSSSSGQAHQAAVARAVRYDPRYRTTSNSDRRSAGMRPKARRTRRDRHGVCAAPRARHRRASIREKVRVKPCRELDRALIVHLPRRADVVAHAALEELVRERRQQRASRRAPRAAHRRRVARRHGPIGTHSPRSNAAHVGYPRSRAPRAARPGRASRSYRVRRRRSRRGRSSARDRSRRTAIASAPRAALPALNSATPLVCAAADGAPIRASTSIAVPSKVI